jgi:hypothetical protein
MSSAALSPNDINVLEKIKDPEASPSVPLLIDSSLPRDPHVSDPSTYEIVSKTESSIIQRAQDGELEFAVSQTPQASRETNLARVYEEVLSDLRALIDSYPKYASAYNNLAQALRRVHGDSVLIHTPRPRPGLSSTIADDETLQAAANEILSCFSTAVSLLAPLTPFTPLSSQAVKTIAQVYTQRASLFFMTAKQMSANPKPKLRKLPVLQALKVESATDVEELASRDFVMGGRYGNAIAKALAVATNPTAKLCGGIVAEAMRKEMAGGE